MLTLFFGSTDKAFQMIFRAFLSYQKQSIKVLDVTYGKGRSWRGFVWNELFNSFELTKMDKIQYEGVVLDVVGDHSDLSNFENESFDVVYYDPPYYFKEFVKSYDLSKSEFEESEVFWSVEDFRKSLSGLKKEVSRLLQKEGFLICKIMDGYANKMYFPNTFLVVNTFVEGGLDIVGHFIVPIQRRNCPDTVRVNHINYLVFCKNPSEKWYRCGHKKWWSEKYDNLGEKLKKLEREFFIDLLENKSLMQELESAFAAVKEKGMTVSKMKMNADTFKNIRENLSYSEYAAEIEYAKGEQDIFGELLGAKIVIDNSVEDRLIILVGEDEEK